MPRHLHLKLKLEKWAQPTRLFWAGRMLDDDFSRAAKLPFVDVLPQQGANVYDMVRRDVLGSVT